MSQEVDLQAQFSGFHRTLTLAERQQLQEFVRMRATGGVNRMESHMERLRHSQYQAENVLPNPSVELFAFSS